MYSMYMYIHISISKRRGGEGRGGGDTMQDSTQCTFARVGNSLPVL